MSIQRVEARSRTGSQTESRLAKKRRQFFCVLSLQPLIGEEGVLTRVEAYAEHYGFPP
jgi:hypothetical protein